MSALYWGAVGLVVLISAVGWVRLVGVGPRGTLPSFVTWRTPGGAALDGPRGGFRPCGHDGVAYAIDGTDVWFACSGDAPASSAYRAAIVHIDPVRLEGRLWSLPGGLDLSSSVALLPGPQRSLALVFYSSTPDASRSRLMGGVVGATGWLHPPVDLAAGKGSTRALGGAWEGQGVEIAVTRPSGDNGEATHGVRRHPAIVHLGADGTTRERTIEADVLFAGLGPSAAIEAAYRRSRSWHFLIREGGPPGEGEVWDVQETGSRVSTGMRARGDVSRSVDLAVAGRSGTGHQVDLQLLADGQIAPLPAAPALSESWKSYRTPSAIEAADGLLRPRPRWRIREFDGRYLGTEHGTMELVAGRIMTSYCPESRLFVWTGPPTEMAESVARLDWCPHFGEPVWVVRPQGGYWLVTGSGAYLTASAEGKRTDSLGLLEHLLAEGADNDAYGAFLGPLVVALLVVLLASGPTVVLLLVLAKVRRSARPAVSSSRCPGWLRLAGVLLYGLAEFVMLAGLWEMVA